MTKTNLTTKRVARLLKTPGRHRDADVKGLLLCVTGPGNASWQLRYQLNGAEKWMGLGSASEFSIKQARERALAARQKLADGIDPLQVRRAEKVAQKLAAAKTMTFEQATWRYFDLFSVEWKNAKWRGQFQNTMRAYVLPTLGALPIESIDTTLVKQVLEPHWLAKAPTMSRVRSRIEAILDWATASGFRAGDNPAAWKTIDKVLPKVGRVARVEHHSALPYGELPAFLVELRKHVGTTPRALEFAVLTCARTNEVRGGTWDEIDFEQKVWTVPAARMKAHKEHRVPLSDAALKLLKSLPVEDGNPYVFIGSQRGAGLSHGAMLVLMGRLRTDATVHGFRSTFRTWAGEQTHYPVDVIEMCLAHNVGSTTERAYARTTLFERRRKLMETWAAFCSSKPVKTGDVVTLRAAT
jgi:integrase